MKDSEFDIGELRSTNIVFFDGVCTLCNSSVDYLISKDKKAVLRYASLQSKTAENLLEKHDINHVTPESIVFYEAGNVWFKSDAVFRICKHLPFPFALLTVFKIIPRFVRDYAYDLIAKNRYKWFGKRDTCRLPKDDERELFYD